MVTKKKTRDDDPQRKRVEVMLTELEAAAERAHYRGAEGAFEFFRAAAECVRGSIDRGDAAGAVIAFNDCMRAWTVEQGKAERARGGKTRGMNAQLDKTELFARFEKARQRGPGRADAANWRLLAQEDLPGATAEEIKIRAGSYARAWRKRPRKEGRAADAKPRSKGTGKSGSRDRKPKPRMRPSR